MIKHKNHFPTTEYHAYISFETPPASSFSFQDISAYKVLQSPAYWRIRQFKSGLVDSSVALALYFHGVEGGVKLHQGILVMVYVCKAEEPETGDLAYKYDYRYRYCYLYR